MPWYVEMRESDPTPGDEVEFRGACDALTLASRSGALALPSIVSGATAEEPELSERAKARAIEKAAKAKTKEQEREAAWLQRESLKERKETKERYREFAVVVAKEGPHRLFTQLGGAAAFADLPVGAPSQGLSPSTSSRSSPYVAKLSQTIYTIPVAEQVDSSLGVAVMCESALSITPLFDDITSKGDQPPVWTGLLQFVKAYSGSRIWRLRGEPRDLVDMVIMDMPEGLPVPGIHANSTVPIWNSHPTRVNDKGRKESPFIHSCFELVGELLRDGAPLFVFYPDSRSSPMNLWAGQIGLGLKRKQNGSLSMASHSLVMASLGGLRSVSWQSVSSGTSKEGLHSHSTRGWNSFVMGFGSPPTVT